MCVGGIPVMAVLTGPNAIDMTSQVNDRYADIPFPGVTDKGQVDILSPLHTAETSAWGARTEDITSPAQSEAAEHVL